MKLTGKRNLLLRNENRIDFFLRTKIKKIGINLFLKEQSKSTVEMVGTLVKAILNYFHVFRVMIQI